MPRHNSYLVRNLDDEGYLEAFLVSAVAAILLVRFYLYVTGFPQVGGKGLHIAHMLWGGLLMLVGITMLLNYLDRDTHTFAAVVSGAGFGLFIDELGKFVTSDNNYFFRPAASLIYFVFILLYLAFRLLRRERHVTRREYLINSIEAFKQAVIEDFDRAYVERARAYLAGHGQSDSISAGLQALLDACPQDAWSGPSRLQRLRRRSRDLFSGLSTRRWFGRAVTVFFLIQALFTLATALFTTIFVTGFVVPSNAASAGGARHLIRQADLLFAVGASALIVFGAVSMVRSRAVAYRFYKAGMLVSIFLTQVFAFYDIQFAALYGLGFNIVGLMLINAAIGRERERSRRAVRTAVALKRASTARPAIPASAELFVSGDDQGTGR